MNRGKHASNKIQIFHVNFHGRHEHIAKHWEPKQETAMVIYNPVYAKLSSCLSSLVIVTSLLTFLTLGKYKGTLASADTARVGKYMVLLTENDISVTEFIPNTTRNINFAVQNFDGREKSEVKLKYRIILDTPENANLPLEYKLYRIYDTDNEGEVTLVNNISDYIEVEVADVTHEYRLEITWPSGYDQIAYQNLTDNIKISVDSEQVD